MYEGIKPQSSLLNLLSNREMKNRGFSPWLFDNAMVLKFPTLRFIGFEFLRTKSMYAF